MLWESVLLYSLTICIIMVGKKYGVHDPNTNEFVWQICVVTVKYNTGRQCFFGLTDRWMLKDLPGYIYLLLFLSCFFPNPHT